MSAGRWRISVTAPDWGHDHLSSEAVVAYVDDELAAGPHLRATEHLAQCRECAAQVFAQGQARSALRTAGGPSLPSSLLSSLRSIPQETDLPAPPAGLSVTADGQLVSVLRPEAAPDARTAGSGRRPHRGLRMGTGVAVSGLAIGAIAFALPTSASAPVQPVPTSANDVLGEPARGPAPVEARLRLAPTRLPDASATATPTATAEPLDR